MSEQGTQPIEYGQPPAGARRRRVLRWVAVVALIVVACIAIRYRGPIVQRAKYVRAWYALANHDLKEGEIVYSTEHADVNRLKNDRRYTLIPPARKGCILRKAPPGMA